MSRRDIASLALSSLLIAVSANADPRIFIPGEREITTNPKLVIADVASHDTRAVYSKQHGIFPRNAKGLVIVLGGTGAAVTSDFGLVASLGPIVLKAANAGFGAIAFDQPVYSGASDPELRETIVSKYSALAANLAWLGHIARYVTELIPTEGRETVLANRMFVGRSTGAAQLAESVHALSSGRPEGEFLRGFRRVTLMGLDGHTPQEIARWHRNEVAFFEANPGTGDKAVYMNSPKLFSEMHWGTQAIANVAATLPEVIIAIGAQDEFTHPKDQLVPARALSRNIPGLRVAIAYHDGFHNPVKKTNRGTPMDEILKMTLDPAPFKPGESAVYIPNDTIYHAAVTSNRCNAELTGH